MICLVCGVQIKYFLSQFAESTAVDDKSNKTCSVAQGERSEKAAPVSEKETCPFCKKELGFMSWCSNCRLKIL